MSITQACISVNIYSYQFFVAGINDTGADLKFIRSNWFMKKRKKLESIHGIAWQ